MDDDLIQHELARLMEGDPAVPLMSFVPLLVLAVFYALWIYPHWKI